MKKTLVSAFVILTACSHPAAISPVIEDDMIDYRHQSSVAAYPETVPGWGDDTYIVTWDNQLYYTDFQTTVPLTYLTYADDTPITDHQNDTPFKYVDGLLNFNILAYGEHLYYLSQTNTIERDERYYLNRLDKKGENREQLMQLPYVPSFFKMYKGHVFIAEDGIDTILHVYDSNLRNERNITVSGSIISMFIQDSLIWICSSRNGEMIIQTVDTDTFEINSFDSNLSIRLFQYADSTRYAVRTMDKTAREVSDPSEIITTSIIYDVSTNQPVFTVENEIIAYFDENRLITTAVNQGPTVYRVYNSAYELIREIKPSDYVQPDGFMQVVAYQQDFSHIIAVVDDVLIFSCLQAGETNYYAYHMDSDECIFLVNEENQ